MHLLSVDHAIGRMVVERDQRDTYKTIICNGHREIVRRAYPIGRGLVMEGDAWSMLILRDAGFGLTRFGQFRRSLGIQKPRLRA